MWTVVLSFVCFLIAVIATFATIAILGLTLTPQDSGIPATGEWGYALIPGGAAVAAFLAGVALVRRLRSRSRQRSR